MTRSTKPPRSAVIIGAGIAGLATAALLARRGIAVTVVEQQPEGGGRAGSFTLDNHPGFRWDTGPSWYLMPEVFERFFRAVGTSTAQEFDLLEINPNYRLFPGGGRPIDVPRGRDDIIELFESLEPGAGAAVDAYLDSASAAYELAVKRFLYTNFSSVRDLAHRDIARNAATIMRLLCTPLDLFVERRFRDPRLRQMLTYPAVFLSTHPERTPALYHLMSHTDLVHGVRYPLGGFAAVVQAIYARARFHGVRFHFSTKVTAITTTSGSGGSSRPTVTGVQVRDRAGHFHHIDADVVISAADRHHTDTVLLPPRLRAHRFRRVHLSDPGFSAVVVLAGVSGRIAQLAHHNLLFSQPWDADFTAVFSGSHPLRPLRSSQSVYVCMPSVTDPTVAPAGHENIFMLIPVPADPSIGHGDAYHDRASAQVSAIATDAIARLRRWAGIPDLESRIVVQRSIGPADFAERYHAWQAGAIGPAHTLHQSAWLRATNVSPTVTGLFYAGATTQPGVGVPMCLISAENVVNRIYS